MRSFARGEKAKLGDLTSALQVAVGVSIVGTGSEVFDVSCFGVDASGKLSDDRYLIFFNQRSSPEGAIAASGQSGDQAELFQVDLGRLPASIDRLVFTATLDGSATMSSVRSGSLRLSAESNEVARFGFSGADFAAERAVIIAELYRKDVWRFAAVGQGFNGGLSALLAHFGGEEAAPTVTPPPTTPAPSLPAIPSTSVANLRKVELDKKMATQAPQLLSLAKKAEVSLAKRNLSDHRARVALCLDISASMSALYKAGKIQRFAEKVLALGTRFDDDGEIDVFLFGAKAHEAGAMGVDNFIGLVDRIVNQRKLEAGTYYGKAMELIRRHYFPDGKGKKRGSPRIDDTPVYVMFLTDGQTMDKPDTTHQIVWSAYEPIFWQFMGIGQSKRDRSQKRGLLARLAPDANFEFLEQIDAMNGRYADNANFFSVEDPEAVADDELYDLMMEEYPHWVRQAPGLGLLRG